MIIYNCNIISVLILIIAPCPHPPFFRAALADVPSFRLSQLLAHSLTCAVRKRMPWGNHATDQDSDSHRYARVVLAESRVCSRDPPSSRKAPLWSDAHAASVGMCGRLRSSLSNRPVRTTTTPCRYNSRCAICTGENAECAQRLRCSVRRIATARDPSSLGGKGSLSRVWVGRTL